MKQRSRLLFWGCILSVGGVIALQAGWLMDYYRVRLSQFDREVNLAFEDAVKKEFQIRGDSLENALFGVLMDTSKFKITSTWMARDATFKYTVADADNLSHRNDFSQVSLTFPLMGQADPRRGEVARRYAHSYREEDIDKHIIFFRTQTLGNYLEGKTKEWSFDTVGLRPIYRGYLAERGIQEPFLFLMSDVDSTLNRSAFPDTISHRYPFITKAFPTYIWAPSRNNYVRACFGRPGTYLLHSMLWLLLGSVCLVAVTTLTLYHLLRTLQKEKRLSAIKNDFISNISHELKTPISTISGALEALEDFDVLDDRPKSQRYIRIARTESRRLSEMVGKILDLSLYERSDFTLRLAPVNIDELVRGLIEHYTLRKDKDIRFQYSSALPASIVRADELHLCNAINNLIDNAVKYSGSRVEIGIRYEQREGYHTISVTDNGMGIPKAEQSMVFDKFYRVPVSRAAVKGQGLGLSYVKAIVDRHRGWYSVESLGASAGSTFTLAIPIYD